MSICPQHTQHPEATVLASLPLVAPKVRQPSVDCELLVHEVFISYATENKPVADAVCATIERSGIRAWIAPRDLLPGQEYAAAIVSAISSSGALVLVFSAASNVSHQVRREVERAVSNGLPIIPLRIEDVEPTNSMEYFVSSQHWLDALTPPLEAHLHRLVVSIRFLLGRDPVEPPALESHPALLDSYRTNLRSEIDNNLVLELYDKRYHEDICIPALFQRADDGAGHAIMEFDDILASSQRASILGEPGSGKTTALRTSCLEMLAGDRFIPVYLPLSFVAGLQSSFEEFIDDEIAALGGRDLLTLEMESGLQSVLLLDGWDELPDERLRATVKSSVLRSGRRFVVTARHEAQRSMPASDRYEIVLLAPERMRSLMSKRLDRPANLERFMRWLRSDNSLQRLAENPLNLSLLGIAYAEEKSAAHRLTRTVLHERALDAILRQHHRPVRGRDMPQAAVESVLQQVAFDVTLAGRGRFFSIREVERAATTSLGAWSEDLLDILVGRLGILRDRRAGRIEFFHLWYQEFLAARHIVQSGLDERTVQRFLGMPSFAGVLPYVAGLLSSERSCALLTQVEIRDPFTFCRAIAETVLDDEQRARLLDRVVSHGSDMAPQMPVRIELGPALACTGNASIPLLLLALSDGSRSDYERRSCLEALALMDAGAPFDSALLRELEVAETGLQWHVIEHIGRRRIEAARGLLTQYRSHPDPIVAADAHWALAELGDAVLDVPDAVLSAVLDCLSVEDRHLQGHALRTLGRLQHPGAVQPLFQFLQQRDKPYRWIVPEAVAMIGGSEAVNVLAWALDDEETTVVAAALRALGTVEPMPPNSARSLLERVDDLCDEETWIASMSRTLGDLARVASTRLVEAAEGATNG